MAIKTSAQAADIRASLTLGTVKKRTITWGNPAVPNINAAVIKNISTLLLLPSVKLANPNSVTKPSRWSKTDMPLFKVAPSPV